MAAHLTQMTGAGMLIHGAGFGTTGRFVRVEARKHLEMIELHLAAGVRLTHAVLPKMIERKRGALIYVASTGAFVPLPGNVTYCATKSFLVAFTESLEPEVASANVRVQVLCPGFTHTEFHDTPEYARFSRGSLPRMMWQSAEEVVAACWWG
jgi:short-subunit dehydrogenase